MSINQYDLSKPVDYLSRQMFLDGTVTVQRFDEYRYPKLAKFEEQARGFYWTPEEITLTQDKMDFKNSSDAVKHIFTSNVLRQTALDSIQGRGPSQIFAPVVSVPEAEALVGNWSFFETSIHSKSYSHIIRNIYGVSKDEFNKIHDTKEIIGMAANVGRYYNDLHVLNCKTELKIHVSEKEYVKAIWLALHTSYALEAIRFMVSFITSLGMVENKIFIGNGNIISLILQDERLHKDWTGYIINQVVKDDPRFAEAKILYEEEVRQIYVDCIREEKDWAKFLFKKGPVIGLNENILCEAVDYYSYLALKDVGIKHMFNHPKSTPVPWYNKHIDISKKQTALQENESTNYVLGAMTDEINYEELPTL